MAKYAYHRTDVNAPELESVAKDLGLVVVKIGRPVDWLVLGFGLAVACEVKDGKGKLRPDQIAFLEAAGAAGCVLRTAEDVVDLHRRLRAMAQCLQMLRWEFGAVPGCQTGRTR